MDLSMKWLNDYVSIQMPPREFSEGMSLSGSKVEGYEWEGEEISNVVVGQVVEMERHPNSDHLWVCQVNVGQDAPIQICTGAQNVNVGDFVPTALHKSTLPGGVQIKKGKLRGLESNGMLCSLSELGLTQHDFPYAIEDGIFILGDDCDLTIGKDIREAIGLNDLKVEFEITSNRPDCLSMIGLAREAAATFRKPLTVKAPVVKAEGQGNVSDYLSVEVRNTEICKRYMAAVVTNVKTGPSPRWMRERLRACGVRPISNIVDITNYVMLEYGQPMHAFDLENVLDHKIIVRNAAEGESIVTLDDVERKLSPEMLVIGDASAPSAIAGVMGSEKSGIHENTKTIVFESACFHGASVRRTAKKVGLRTEASGRYEKGLDSRNCAPALARACELIELLGVGDVVPGVIDIDNDQKEPHKVPLDVAWTNRFLGIDLTEQQMVDILATLDIPVENGMVIAPTFRADLEGKADVAEEIGRIYGYDRIPTATLTSNTHGEFTPRQKFDRKIHSTLQACGFSEIITYSFISPSFYDKICLPADSALRKSIVISNPLGEDKSIMRTTALPSMLDTLARNYNYRNPEAALYEIATEYLPTGENALPDEKPAVLLGSYGKNADFYQLKGAVETLLRRLNVSGAEFTACTDNPSYHPGRCAVITIDGEVIGVMGEIHPVVAANFGLETRAYVAQLSGDALYSHVGADKLYHPLPKFPASSRDLAVTCDEDLPVAAIEKVIREKAGKLLESVSLFDVYRGAQIAAGKKSVAYSILLRAADRTLTVEECDKMMNSIFTALEGIGAEVRR